MIQNLTYAIYGALDFPDISPYLLEIGSLKIRWYSVIYIGAFFLMYFMFRRFSKTGFIDMPLNKIDDLVLWCFIGDILGARLFYILFYNLETYIHHPARIFMIWRGGLSFHGGMVGILIVCWIFARKNKLHFMNVIDVIALGAPIALGLGRIGNFLNQELWGRVASPDLPWAVVFPLAGKEPRHPSQFYEAIAEGLALGIILWTLKRYKPKHGVLSAVFLTGYGVGRFIVEYFREPDEQLGLFFFNLSMGQILCSVMILLGVLWLIALYKTNWLDRFDYHPAAPEKK